jgi:hypothetical protein
VLRLVCASVDPTHYVAEAGAGEVMGEDGEEEGGGFPKSGPIKVKMGARGPTVASGWLWSLATTSDDV